MGRQQLLYQYPPDLAKAQKHRLAKRIFKGVEKDPACEECECCDRKIGVEIVQSSCCYDKNQLAFLGPGIPLLFAFIRNCILLLLVFTLIFAGFCFYSNFSSNNCSYDSVDCEYNIFNTISFANKMNESDLLSIQNYILLAFVVVNVVLLQLFRYNFRKIEEECDDIVNSPSDYAIILRRLPEETTKQDIEKMVEMRRTQLTYQEKKITQNLKIDHIVLSYAMGEYTRVIEKNKENFKKFIDEGKHAEFKAEPLPKLAQTAKLAIVVFSRQQSKDFFIYKPSIPQKLLQFVCDPCTPLSHLMVKNERVSIERAPQPDDVVWQNSKISISGSIMRKTIFNILGFIVLLIGGAAQYWLAVLQNSVTDATEKQIYSIGLSILVSIFNFIILQFLIFSSSRERNETLTEYNKVLTQKISMFQFLNTGIFVVAANFLADFESFSIAEGLPTDVTTVMLMNAISPNLTLWALNYFEIIGKVNRWLIRTEKLKVTQLQANQVWQGPVAEIPYKYAYVLKTIWLTAFYAPLSPVVVPISALGLTINYFIEKHLYRYVYSVPNMLSSMVNDSAVELMEYFPLIISIGEFVIYIYMKRYNVVSLPDNWSIPIYISLALSFLNIVLPMDELNKCFAVKIDDLENPPYEKVQEKFQVTYEMTNPAYECKKKRKRDVFLFNQVFGGQGKNAAVNITSLIGGNSTDRALVRDPLLNKTTQEQNPNNVSLIDMVQQNGQLGNLSKLKNGDTTMNTTQGHLNKTFEQQNPFAAFMKPNLNNSFANDSPAPKTSKTPPKQVEIQPVNSNGVAKNTNGLSMDKTNLIGNKYATPTGAGQSKQTSKNQQIQQNSNNVLPQDLLQEVDSKETQKILPNDISKAENLSQQKRNQQKEVKKDPSPSYSSNSYKNLTKDLNFKYNNSSSDIPVNSGKIPIMPDQIPSNQPQKNSETLFQNPHLGQGLNSQSPGLNSQSPDLNSQSPGLNSQNQSQKITVGQPEISRSSSNQVPFYQETHKGIQSENQIPQVNKGQIPNYRRNNLQQSQHVENKIIVESKPIVPQMSSDQIKKLQAQNAQNITGSDTQNLTPTISSYQPQKTSFELQPSNDLQQLNKNQKSFLESKPQISQQCSSQMQNEETRHNYSGQMHNFQPLKTNIQEVRNSNIDSGSILASQPQYTYNQPLGQQQNLTNETPHNTCQNNIFSNEAEQCPVTMIQQPVDHKSYQQNSPSQGPGTQTTSALGYQHEQIKKEAEKTQGGQHLLDSLAKMKKNVENQPHNLHSRVQGSVSGKQLSNHPYKFPNQPNSNHQITSKPLMNNFVSNSDQIQNQANSQPEFKIPLLSLATKVEPTNEPKKIFQKPVQTKTFAEIFPHYLEQKKVEKQTRQKFLEEGVKQLDYIQKKFTKSGAVFFQSPKSTEKKNFPHVEIHVPGLKPVSEIDQLLKNSSNRRSFGSKTETNRKEAKQYDNESKDGNGEFSSGEVYNPRFMPKR